MEEKADNLPVNLSASASSNTADDTTETQLDEIALVERCQRGDMDAFEALLVHNRQRVYVLAYGMLRNEQDATDVTQETFVRAWQAIGSFKKNSRFYTWLYRITTNLCIDYARRRARKPSEPFEEGIDPKTDASVEHAPSNNPSPTAELERGDLRAQIDAALLELSEEHRAVIQLREFENLDYAEIAKILHCNIGTVMSRLHYARKHLQRLLKEVI
jgi:RNA polymerase sigma-70 factor (ECF subfamily)